MAVADINGLSSFLAVQLQHLQDNKAKLNGTFPQYFFVSRIFWGEKVDSS